MATPIPASRMKTPDAPPGTPHERFLEFARWTIERELPAAERFLPPGEREEFIRYYRTLPPPGDEAGIRRYLRGFWRSEGGWAARWIARRAATAGDGVIRVLDAGSGFGTYSMLYAIMGGDVTGADLRPDRLSAAERRLGHYREQTGRELAVQYERADLTKPWSRDYDLVWVFNALSHIDPLDGFLAEVRAHLRPHGVLVIGDINGSYMPHQRRLARLRQEVHQEYVAPDGQRHAYAVERMFPPGELRSILGGAGLRVVHHELYWGGLGVLPDVAYAGLSTTVQRAWWLGAPVARRQLIVATPAL